MPERSGSLAVEDDEECSVRVIGPLEGCGVVVLEACILGERVRLWRRRTSSWCVAEDGCFPFSECWNCVFKFVLILRDCTP